MRAPALGRGVFVFVMAGLVPAIHVFTNVGARKTWMPATSAGMTTHHEPHYPPRH
jgi:hypothetical protein